MKNWEYKIEKDLIDEELDEFGYLGWELVSVVWKTHRNVDYDPDEVFYFKREKFNH